MIFLFCFACKWLEINSNNAVMRHKILCLSTFSVCLEQKTVVSC